MKNQDAAYRSILQEAHGAAIAAQVGMVEDKNAFDCGFAWVTIDGQSGLARYCRKMLKLPEHQNGSYRAFFGDSGYPRGWQFWQPGNAPVQSVGIHEAGARAFRDALAKHGIRADVGSRLD